MALNHLETMKFPHRKKGKCTLQNHLILRVLMKLVIERFSMIKENVANFAKPFVSSQSAKNVMYFYVPEQKETVLSNIIP